MSAKMSQPIGCCWFRGLTTNNNLTTNNLCNLDRQKLQLKLVVMAASRPVPAGAIRDRASGWLPWKTYNVADFKYNHRFKAEDGSRGPNNRTGGRGAIISLKFPVAIIYDAETGGYLAGADSVCRSRR